MLRKVRVVVVLKKLRVAAPKKLRAAAPKKLRAVAPKKLRIAAPKKPSPAVREKPAYLAPPSLVAAGKQALGANRLLLLQTIISCLQSDTYEIKTDRH